MVLLLDMQSVFETFFCNRQSCVWNLGEIFLSYIFVSSPYYSIIRKVYTEFRRKYNIGMDNKIYCRGGSVAGVSVIFNQIC